MYMYGWDETIDEINTSHQNKATVKKSEHVIAPELCSLILEECLIHNIKW